MTDSLNRSQGHDEPLPSLETEEMPTPGAERAANCIEAAYDDAQNPGCEGIEIIKQEQDTGLWQIQVASWGIADRLMKMIADIKLPELLKRGIRSITISNRDDDDKIEMDLVEATLLRDVEVLLTHINDLIKGEVYSSLVLPNTIEITTCINNPNRLTLSVEREELAQRLAKEIDLSLLGHRIHSASQQQFTETIIANLENDNLIHRGYKKESQVLDWAFEQLGPITQANQPNNNPESQILYLAKITDTQGLREFRNNFGGWYLPNFPKRIRFLSKPDGTILHLETSDALKTDFPFDIQHFPTNPITPGAGPQYAINEILAKSTQEDLGLVYTVIMAKNPKT